MTRLKLFMLVLMVGLFVAALPAAAQEGDCTVGDVCVVTGALTRSGDDLMLGDFYLVAPAGSFTPSDYADGDILTVMGALLPDEQTIQATALCETLTCDSFVDTPGNGGGNQVNNSNQGRGRPNTDAANNQNDDADDGDSGNDRGNGRGNQGDNGGNGRSNQANAAGDAQGRGADDNGARSGFYCDNRGKEQPGAARLVERYSANYAAVINAFCDGGYGIGELAMAYRLAQFTGQSAQFFLDARASGFGWGQIFRDNNVSPRDFVAGRGNGNANANANNNARANGNGNGNGRGNNNGDDD